MQQSPLFILVRFTGLAGHPGGDKTLILGGNDMRLDVEEVFSDEVFNLFIAAYHQAKHRRLHAPDREYPLVTRVTAKDGVRAGHIDPV